MIERIVFTKPDGSCGILIPTGDIPLNEVLIKDVPAGSSNIREITTAELPQDRLFRDAWDDSNSEDFIGLDLIKAQAIAHDMRRDDRDTKLTPLDKEQVHTSTTQTRKDEIIIEKLNILNNNSLLQIGIDEAISEIDLRTILNNAGIY